MQSANQPKAIRVGIIANEVSGDQLAAALIQALQERSPEVVFEGMTGPLMEAAGCRSLASMDPVMGLFEVLGHLPGLLKTRRQLISHFLNDPPDLVLGVDAPDFNLALETRLKQSGIKTAHWVSPTVWAWRQGRVKKLRQAVDLMLCIFDFEVDFLQQHQVPAAYVGHPLADQIPLRPTDPIELRSKLGLAPELPVVALLPGSRMSEVSRLAEPFAETACWLKRLKPELQFVAPMVNETIKQAFQAALAKQSPSVDVKLLDGEPRLAIGAADLVLTASGTATLETLLLKKPMVVAYRLSPLTAWLIRRFKLLKTPYVAIANLLSEKMLAPEFLQEACQAELMGQAIIDLLDDPQQREEIAKTYQQIHQHLRQNAAQRAADLVLDLIGPKT
ncbi:MAG: lipid-A-disaccharide synthase [Candidatus Thiodiazotropha lotti]|nr:lipid-A-disaccharide synthase [Candidatus Thiodiazotropha lotti]MCG7920067.1 lipid-A-disaccharide synthase [Candidatus Thiodiazotropha lotti]MCG7985872.1 lipid-A-disaccharide synthase [Candidatus Thiodiazotropha lotti]MCG8002409.1 lipid-A-disaccharide synthase [Candidatus Thiodiazotropha lotti]MCG8006296.1 lipid-A-disaccharide synthase [Candidatus Thiodiazotropha lotti]